VQSHLIDRSGARTLELNREALDGLRAAATFFWLDLREAEPADVELIGEVFDFHPLAVEDAINFGQRPKLDEYDDYVFLVVFGHAPDEDNLVEVHVFYSERFLITVRRDHCPAFVDVRERQARRKDPVRDPILVLYHVIDGLVDSFFPLLADWDDLIDAIEEGISRQPNDEQLRRIFMLKRELVRLRKVIAPQRDLAASIASGMEQLPGATIEAERAFRDVYDHLIRLTDQLDSYRDLVTGVMDVYLSTVSNRLNVVMKQLTVLATVFLPLTFITGFFGQNFSWMVRVVGGQPAFWVLGVALPLAVAFALLSLFRRRGWI
jgi:magnesium transporter